MDAFYDMTPREFVHAMEQYNKEKEIEYKSDYERMRLVIYNMWKIQNATIKRKTIGTKLLRSPKAMLPFEWDRGNVLVEKKQSLEEMKKQVHAIAALYGKKK